MSLEYDYQRLQRAIEFARLEQELTLRAISKELHMSISTVWKVCCGPIDKCNISTVARVAERVGLRLRTVMR
jgi:hypothetical protein